MPQDAMRTKLLGVRRSLQSAEIKLAAINREQIRDTAASAATRAALESVNQALISITEALGEHTPTLAPVHSGLMDEGL